MAATVGERLAQTFVELADTLVAGYDLMEFLQTLTERCVELLQLQHDEGPCPDSFRTGRAVIVSDIRSPEARARWPRFAAAAAELGLAGVHSLPMRLRDQVIGTLNLFTSTAGSLDPAVARAARALVDVATIGILQERAIRERELVAGQLQTALNSRVVIEQAKGILAERLQTSPDEAFLLLRRYARNHNHALTELAGDVIRGTAPIIRMGPRA